MRIDFIINYAVYLTIIMSNVKDVDKFHVFLYENKEKMVNVAFRTNLMLLLHATSRNALFFS